MINVPNVRKWIAVLRSGKYKQIVGVLALGPRGRCALGAAGMPGDEIGPGIYAVYYQYPRLGLSDSMIVKVVEKNDNDRWTFEQIADMVERDCATDFALYDARSLATEKEAVPA